MLPASMQKLFKTVRMDAATGLLMLTCASAAVRHLATRHGSCGGSCEKAGGTTSNMPMQMMLLMSNLEEYGGLGRQEMRWLRDGEMGWAGRKYCLSPPRPPRLLSNFCSAGRQVWLGHPPRSCPRTLLADRHIEWSPGQIILYIHEVH